MEEIQSNEMTQAAMPVSSPSVEAATQLPAPQPVYQIEAKKGSIMKIVGMAGVFLVIVLAGIGTGYGLQKLIKPSVNSSGVMGAPGTVQANEIAVGKTYGAEDTKKFPDSSEGIVVKGGMDGEGTHHLIRPGGVSQTVYLTSSVVDLDLFAGHKVQVKGETFSAQKAAWFMDVGSVKVIELNAATPAPEPTPTPKGKAAPKATAVPVTGE